MESEGAIPSFSREEYTHRPDLMAAGGNILLVAFNQPAGRFSGVFQCKDGWRIIKVLSHTTASDLAYPALRDRISEDVFEKGEWMLYVPTWTRIKARATEVGIRLPGE
jgi:hypothetical protein